MNVELQRSTEDDYAFCYDLTKENMYDLFCRHWGEWVDSKFQKAFNVDNFKIIKVAEKQVGYFSYKPLGESLYIDNIQIKQEFQRKGLGTIVLKGFIDEHQSQNIKLTTFEDNPAKRLYERLGFKVVEKNGTTLKMEKLPNQPRHSDG